MKVLSTYWRHAQAVINLGDYITEYLLLKMGHEFVPYTGVPQPDHPHVLLAVGSILAPNWIDGFDKPIKVWGSGCPAAPVGKLRQDIEYHAVRGPMTRDALGLPAETVLGDPGILLPGFLPASATPQRAGVIYAPHCSIREALSKDHVRATGADRFFDITCRREDFENRVTEIASASFVLAGSLHAAIISQAYGVPWALCVPEPLPLVMPFKHQEWAAYLGISPSVVSNYEEGRAWWDETGSKGAIPEGAAEALLSAFPYH